MTEPRSAVPPFLYLFCRVLEAWSTKRIVASRGQRFSRERRKRPEKKESKKKKRNGHGEAKARNPWMDETMRREEVEGEEESR